MRDLKKEEVKAVSGGFSSFEDELRLPTVTTTAPRPHRPWEDAGVSPGEYYGFSSPLVIPVQGLSQLENGDGSETPAQPSEWNPYIETRFVYNDAGEIIGVDVKAEVDGWFDENKNGFQDAGEQTLPENNWHTPWDEGAPIDQWNYSQTFTPYVNFNDYIS